MHENANHAFVGELSSPHRPDVRHVVVHGRAYALDRWVVVATELVPAPENGLMETYYHGATYHLGTEEVLTWGGEPAKVSKLPIVSHAGVKSPYPGWVWTARKSDGKRHVTRYEYADTRTDKGVFCHRRVNNYGALDANWFMSDDNSCKDCQKALSRIIGKL